MRVRHRNRGASGSLSLAEDGGTTFGEPIAMLVAGLHSEFTSLVEPGRHGGGGQQIRFAATRSARADLQPYGGAIQFHAADRDGELIRRREGHRGLTDVRRGRGQQSFRPRLPLAWG